MFKYYTIGGMAGLSTDGFGFDSGSRSRYRESRHRAPLPAAGSVRSVTDGRDCPSALDPVGRSRRISRKPFGKMHPHRAPWLSLHGAGSGLQGLGREFPARPAAIEPTTGRKPQSFHPPG